MKTFLLIIIMILPVLIYNGYFLFFGEKNQGYDSNQAMISAIIGVLSFIIGEKLLKRQG